MSDKPISPLRQRMIDDMTARRFSEKVQKTYVRHVRTFAAFLGRSPDTATSEDHRRFQLHMAQQQISPGSINAAIAALRFFFNVTLERPDLVRPLRTVNEPRRAPVVLSQANLQENQRVFCNSCRDCFSRKFPRAREGWWRRRWGRRPFRRRRDVHRRRIWRGWFSRRQIWWGRFSPGRENVRRRIQPSPLLRRLQCLCGEPIQSVAP